MRWKKQSQSQKTIWRLSKIMKNVKSGRKGESWMHTSSDSPVYAWGWAKLGQVQVLFKRNFSMFSSFLSLSRSLVHVASGGPTFHWTLHRLFPIHTTTHYLRDTVYVCVLLPKEPDWPCLVNLRVNGQKPQWKRRTIGVGLRNSPVPHIYTAALRPQLSIGR